VLAQSTSDTAGADIVPIALGFIMITSAKRGAEDSMTVREELDRFLRVAADSLQVRTPSDLNAWLCGDFQYFLPHHMFVAVSNYGESTQLRCDVVAGPVVQADSWSPLALVPHARALYQRWRNYGRFAYELSHAPLSMAANMAADLGCARVLTSIRSLLVHGVNDAPNGKDRVYIAMQCDDESPRRSLKMMRILLPYIDLAFGRAAAHQTADMSASLATNNRLTAREVEIMVWVEKGQSNQQIADRLDISLFTVKNHLRHIFAKLDVVTRAQAVAKFDRGPG